MSTARRLVRTIVSSGALITLAISCASAPQKKQDDWPEATRTDWEHKDDPCKEKGGEPRQCTSDQDCCEGFTCTIDPERSRVTRYCIEG